MRIFVTGASGFVGGAVTKRLIAASNTVVAMSRSEASTAKLRALGAEPVSCDLATVNSSHLSGCDAVIHCAAFVREWGSYAEFYEANVTGTKNMLTAAQQAGVRRFIHIGTEAACFHGQDMSNLDESTPLAPHSPYPYSATKAQAEAVVVAANSPALTTIVVRPRMIWGPGDTVILPFLMSMVRGGKFKWVENGRYLASTCHIDNLVAGIEAALTRGVGGQAYFIVDDGVVSIKEFFTRLLATQGVEVNAGSIPGWVARWTGWAVEGAYAWLWPTAKPPVTRFVTDMASVNCTISAEKAKREVGWNPIISRDEGLRAMPRLEQSK